MSVVVNPFLIGGGSDLTLSETQQWQNAQTSDRTVTNAVDGYLVVLGWRDGSGSFYTYAKAGTGVNTLTLMSDLTQGYGSATKGGASIYRLQCDAGAVVTIYGTSTRNSDTPNQNGAYIAMFLTK